jgi:chemotaxis protein CheD
MAAQSDAAPPPIALTREGEREREREFGHIKRSYDMRLNAVVATLAPGDYYVAIADELISTVLGSCVSACIRDRRLRFGGMNHFMLPIDESDGNSTWGTDASSATRFGNVAMERLINAMLKLGSRRGDLEVKLVGGGKVLDAMTDIGARNIQFVRDYVRAEGLQVIGEDLGRPFRDGSSITRRPGPRVSSGSPVPIGMSSPTSGATYAIWIVRL